MFRLKFALGFILLVAVQAFAAYFVIQSSLLPVVDEDSEIALRRSAALVEKSQRIDEFALIEKARFVANRPALRRAMVHDHEGDADRERHADVFKHLDTERIRFTEFNAPRHADTRNLDLSLLHRRPSSHEMFMALDASGFGVASLAWAEWTGENVAADFPVVLDVMETGEPRLDLWNFSWRRGEDRNLYSVAIVPIRHPDAEEFVGVVVLGTLINDGLAGRSQALVADGLGADAAQTPSDRAEVLTPEVAYFRGDRIHASTLRSRDQELLARQLFDEGLLSRDVEDPERIFTIDLADSEARVIVRFFTGQFSTPDPTGVILITNRTEALSPLKKAQQNLLILGLLLAILGVLALGVVFYLFLQPFEKLEDGIQEILSGDKDFVFEKPSANNDIANGLAHHLNLMSAFLQGKPMPDDEPGMSGSWGTMEDSKEAESDEKPSIAGIPMGLGRSSKKSEDESAGDAPEETT